METTEVVGVARSLFSEEPRILRVEAVVRREAGRELGLDFTFVVDGDVYEGESRVIPVLVEFMRRYPSMPVESVVLPSSVHLEPHGVVVFSRDSERLPSAGIRSDRSGRF